MLKLPWQSSFLLHPNTPIPFERVIMNPRGLFAQWGEYAFSRNLADHHLPDCRRRPALLEPTIAYRVKV